MTTDDKEAAKETKQHKAKKPHHENTHHTVSMGGIFVLVFLCFVAGFIGAWVFVGTDVARVATEESIAEQTQRLVVEEGEVVADVAERVSPSVVSIVTQSQYDGVGVPLGGSGTGIIISEDGYIVTNKHVVPDTASKVTIVLSDGTRHDDVEVVGRDPLNDLAFLQVESDTELTPANLADSDDVKVGEKVIAIGNALGQYQNSVTSGIISGLGRPVTAQNQGDVAQLEDLLQTDAAINPGNSGGPLVNMSGEVVGINTALVEDAQGIGFAIPINVAKGMIGGLLENGTVTRSFLGVEYIMLSPAISRELEVEQEQGAFVREDGVVAGSPAEDAGIQAGDIITEVDDEIVGEDGSLATLLAEYRPGHEVSLKVIRDGEQMTLDVVLDEHKE